MTPKLNEGGTYVFWMPDYSVGLEDVDAQHKKIFAMFNELHTAICAPDQEIAIDTVLEELADYITTHFATEKFYLHDLPEFAKHEKEHWAFIRKSSQFTKDYQRKPRQELAYDILLFLAQWMKDHIRGTDKHQFALYLERRTATPSEEKTTMAKITLRGTPTTTCGELPPLGATAPAFTLTGTDLNAVQLSDFGGKAVVLNIFPSIDTPVCAASVRRFNAEAAQQPNTVVLCISADLPFAHKRFCEVEGLARVIPASTFRSPGFASSYGVGISDGPLTGLLARAVVVIDPQGKVAYTELVSEIGADPNFEAALRALAAVVG